MKQTTLWINVTSRHCLMTTVVEWQCCYFVEQLLSSPSPSFASSAPIPAIQQTLMFLFLSRTLCFSFPLYFVPFVPSPLLYIEWLSIYPFRCFVWIIHTKWNLIHSILFCLKDYGEMEAQNNSKRRNGERERLKDKRRPVEAQKKSRTVVIKLQ